MANNNKEVYGKGLLVHSELTKHELITSHNSNHVAEQERQSSQQNGKASVKDILTGGKKIISVD